MKIFFLDQSGKLGGAELCLADIAKTYRDDCKVALFADGVFRELLEKEKITVEIITNNSINVKKDSNLLGSLASISTVIPLIFKVANIARNYDIIYANTQKALVIGALASVMSGRLFVYHLHDILCSEHFSWINRYIAVTLANRCASLVIANSQATRKAFIKAGGREDIANVVYNGFDPEKYCAQSAARERIRRQFGLKGKFVVGHFSRLSPWKGQHVLIEALTYCPKEILVILVGDALFGEQDYVEQLHQQVAELGLKERVQFLGFRSDVVPLMSACDLVAHTSIAPEPFGRVIVEGMLCQRPVVAANAGGATELVDHGKTGWLHPPGDARKLADIIMTCRDRPKQAAAIAHAAKIDASQRFNSSVINRQITQLLSQVLQI